MEVFFCWLCIVVLCALIAKDKNRNIGIAILCGVLFGIFALIYYCVVGKKEQQLSIKMVYRLIKLYSGSCPFDGDVIFTAKTEEECWDYYKKYLKGKECVKGWHYEVRQFIEQFSLFI